MRFFALGFVLAAAAGAAAGYVRARPAPPEQPVAFNHAVHAKFEVACTDCHRLAAASEAATLPPIEVCTGCHEEPAEGSAEQAKLHALAEAGRPLEWVRVTDVPDHVLFSHRRHVALAKIECEACHGAIGMSERPPEGPAIEPDMDAFCIDCHKRNEASVTCLACHR